MHNAINYLENTAADDQDFVLVHDAARPCLRYSDLDLLIQKLEQDDVGGILAAPVSDTLKVVEKQETHNTVNKTLDRTKAYMACIHSSNVSINYFKKSSCVIALSKI